MSIENTPESYEPIAEQEPSQATCMFADLRAAARAGSDIVGGTTVIIESPHPEEYRPEKYVRQCGQCALCNVAAEFRHQSSGNN